MKKSLLPLLFLLAALPLASCGAADAERVDLYAFADSSLSRSLDAIAQRYQLRAPNVRLRVQYGSSGNLAAQIREGAPCDVFLCASASLMDSIDGDFFGVWERNPENLDLLLPNSRTDFLENQLVLAVPTGNPKGIRNFAHLSALLKQRGFLLSAAAVGDPLGDYTGKLFDYYHLNERATSGGVAYAENATETASRVRSGIADGAILYRSDADGLTVIDTADESMCGKIVYSAAALADTAHEPQAFEFLDYLIGAEASDIFQRDGFSLPSEDETPSEEESQVQAVWEPYWEAVLPEDLA